MRHFIYHLDRAIINYYYDYLRIMSNYRNLLPIPIKCKLMIVIRAYLLKGVHDPA